MRSPSSRSIATRPAAPVESSPARTQSAFASLSHLTNASWNIAGMVGYNAARWITVVAIARLGGAMLLGEYALATALVTPFFLFANLQLPGLLATDVARRIAAQSYLTVNTFGSLLALVLAVLFGVGEGREIALAVGLFAFARSLDSTGELIGGSLQRQGRFRPIAIGQILNGVCTGIATVVALQLRPDAPSMAIASIIGSAIALTFISQYATFREWWDTTTSSFGRLFAEVPELLKLGLPMGFAAGLIGLGNSLPTLVLDGWVDKTDLGMFSALSLPVLGIGMVIASAGQVAAPQLATLVHAADYRNAKRHIVLLIVLGSAIGLAAVIGALTFGEILLVALYGPEYRVVTGVLVILCVAAAVRCGYTYVGVVLMVIRRPQIQLYARVVALLVLGLALRLLVPQYGIAGAAWAILIATIVEGFAWTAILALTWRTFSPSRS